MPGIMTYVGYAFIVASLTYICFQVYIVARSKSRNVALMSAIYTIAALYMLGLGAKMALVGPDFLRWHVADIGFPVAVGLIFLAPRGSNRTATWRTTQERIGIGLVLSYGYEIAAGRMVASLEGEKEIPYIGGFDWVDIVAYTIGAVLAIGLCQPLYKAELELAARKDEAVRAEKARIRELRSERKKATITAGARSKHGRKRSRKRQ